MRAIVEYGVLRFESSGGVTSPRDVALPFPGSVRFGGWTLRSELRELDFAAALACRVPDGSVGVLDADELDLATLGSAPGARRPDSPARTRRLQASAGPLHRPAHPPRAALERPDRAERPEIVWVPGVATAEPFRLSEGRVVLVVLRAEHECAERRRSSAL